MYRLCFLVALLLVLTAVLAKPRPHMIKQKDNVQQRTQPREIPDIKGRTDNMAEHPNIASPIVERGPISDDKKVVCYFPNWGQYRTGLGKYRVEDIDPHICTHLVYAFARINGLQLGPYEPNDFLRYGQMNALKSQNPALVTMISVGGATMGTQPFEFVSSTPQNRRQFSVNAAEYAREHGFDGVDIDWEYPRPEDRDNLSELIKEMKEHFVEEALQTQTSPLQLSLAFSASEYRIHNCYDSVTLGVYLDIANIMSYDLHGGWDPVTGHHSGLHGYYYGDPYCMEHVLGQYLEQGMPAEKIMMGIPTYGRSFRLCNPSNHDARDCSEGYGDMGPYTQTQGSLAYYEICTDLESGQMVREYDSVQQVPYAYGGDQWVGYDDVQSIQVKRDFVITHRLGGFMFWDLSMDDFDNICGGGRYPLIKAISSPTGTTTTPTTTPATTPATPTTTTTLLPRTTTTTRRPITTTTTTRRPITTTTSTRRTTTSSAQSPVVECEYEGQYIRDPYDCSVFYQCTNSVPYRQECGSPLHFDMESYTCNYPWLVDCTPLPPPSNDAM